jgi:hypothetical protein
MVRVWVRDDQWQRTRFHRSPDCRQLQKRPSRGEHKKLLYLDLEDVVVRPCLTCYPDAPRLNIVKRYCADCGSRRACAHNGGIEVVGPSGRPRWVWPTVNNMAYYRRLARQAV